MKRSILLILFPLCAVLSTYAQNTVATSAAEALKFTWAKQIGASSDQCYNVEVDEKGNFYLAGDFLGTDMDFDPSEGVYSLSPQGSKAIFVAKYTAQGQFVWAKHFSNNYIFYDVRLEVNSENEIVILGHFKGTVDFDPGPGTRNATATGSTDTFACLLNKDGNLVDFFQQPLDYLLEPGAWDNSGNRIVATKISETRTFETVNGAVTITPQYYDIVVSRTTRDHKMLWIKQIGGTDIDGANSVDIDLKTGDIFVTGYFNSTVDFDPGPGVFNLTAQGFSSDIFVMKLDSMGNFKWARQMGGPASDVPNDIIVANDGTIFLTGYFNGTADFNPGAGVFNLSEDGNDSDLFIATLDKNGNFLWAGSAGGPGLDEGKSITMDGEGDVYVTGIFDDTVDFNPGKEVNTLKATSRRSIFILKFSQD